MSLFFFSLSLSLLGKLVPFFSSSDVYGAWVCDQPAASPTECTLQLPVPLPEACCLLRRQMNKTDVQVFLLKVGVINTPHEGMSVSEQQDPGYK